MKKASLFVFPVLIAILLTLASCNSVTTVKGTDAPPEDDRTVGVNVLFSSDKYTVEIYIPDEAGNDVSVIAVKNGVEDWQSDNDSVLAIDQLTLDPEGSGSVTFASDCDEGFFVTVTGSKATYKKEVPAK